MFLLSALLKNIKLLILVFRFTYLIYMHVKKQ